MSEVIHGIVHGKTIVLEKEPGMADGQPVEVIVRPSVPRRVWGDGIRASAGAFADRPEMDAAMEEIQRERRQSTFREVVE